VLDGVSYVGVLERGFALVRGFDGHIRRRAASVATGETLSLTFADGAREAVAGGAPRPRPAKPKPGQGDLF
jgi:exodeoxyribonuclease VII large subunit